MARCHTRCRACRGRKVLPKPPLQYECPPLCVCGGVLVADVWMNTRNTKATLCGCDGYPFPYHRRGSKGEVHACKFNNDGSSRFEIEALPGISGENFPF